MGYWISLFFLLSGACVVGCGPRNAPRESASQAQSLEASLSAPGGADFLRLVLDGSRSAESSQVDLSSSRLQGSDHFMVERPVVLKKDPQSHAYIAPVLFWKPAWKGHRILKARLFWKGYTASGQALKGLGEGGAEFDPQAQLFRAPLFEYEWLRKEELQSSERRGVLLAFELDDGTQAQLEFSAVFRAEPEPLQIRSVALDESGFRFEGNGRSILARQRLSNPNAEPRTVRLLGSAQGSMDYVYWEQLVGHPHIDRQTGLWHIRGEFELGWVEVTDERKNAFLNTVESHAIDPVQGVKLVIPANGSLLVDWKAIPVQGSVRCPQARHGVRNGAAYLRDYPQYEHWYQNGGALALLRQTRASINLDKMKAMFTEARYQHRSTSVHGELERKILEQTPAGHDWRTVFEGRDAFDGNQNPSAVFAPSGGLTAPQEPVLDRGVIPGCDRAYL